MHDGTFRASSLFLRGAYQSNATKPYQSPNGNPDPSCTYFGHKPSERVQVRSYHILPAVQTYVKLPIHLTQVPSCLLPWTLNTQHGLGDPLKKQSRLTPKPQTPKSLNPETLNPLTLNPPVKAGPTSARRRCRALWV